MRTKRSTACLMASTEAIFSARRRIPTPQGVLLGTEKFSKSVTANMLLIAFGVLVCAFGEVNLVLKGLASQLSALCFEVGMPFIPRLWLFLTCSDSLRSGIEPRSHCF